jgi:hypothetical protein
MPLVAPVMTMTCSLSLRRLTAMTSSFVLHSQEGPAPAKLVRRMAGHDIHEQS